MPGKQVGKLSIRVLPDTTRFRQDLSLLIKRIENSMAVNLKVRADTRQAELEIRRFRAEASKQSVELRVGAATLIAKAQLAALSRARVVPLVVRVQQASLAKAAAALGALSGLRLTSNILRDFNTNLARIDVNLPKIGRMATGLSALASILLSSSAGVVTVTGDLVKMGNAALVLPAMFAGIATGVTVLALALKDSKTQLAELGPSMSALQDSISGAFWTRAKAPIVEFVRSILPQLQQGVTATADALGTQTAAIAGAFQQSLGGGVLDAMFTRLVETMNIVTTGASAFAQSLTTIGTVGSNYLPRLAAFVVKIGEGFNTWVQLNAANGMLDAYIEDGITQMKNFGRAIDGVIGILRGIDSAATAAGGGGLASFADSVQGAAAILQAPEVQTALTTFLTGADAGLAGIGSGLRDFGTTLVGLAPTIATVLTLGGQALGTLITAIATGIAQPEFKNGLTGLFFGLKEGIEALAPAIPSLASLFGTIGKAVGDMAASFGPLLATFKTTFAPILESLIVAITPLIPLLVGGLTDALNGLGPAFAALGSFIGDNPQLIQGLALALLGVAAAVKAVQLGSLIAGLAASAGAWLANTAAIVANKAQTLAIVALYAKDLIVGLARSAAAVVTQTGAWIANTAAQIAQKVALIAGAVASGIATAAQWALNLALTANPIGLIIAAIVAVVAALIYFFTQTELGQAIWTEFTRFLGEAWANIVAVATVVFTELGNFFTDLWNGIVAAVTLAVTTVSTVITTVVAFIAAAWNGFWTGLFTVVSTVWTAIVTWVTAAITAVSTVITTVVGFIVAAWNGYWNSVFAVINAVWTGITTFVSDAIARVRAVIFAVVGAVLAFWTGVWSSIVGVVSGAWSGITGFVSKIVSGIQSLIGTIGTTLGEIPGKVMAAFSNAGKFLYDAGKSIVQGLIDGIKNMIGAVKAAAENVMGAISDFFPHSPAKKGPFSGRGWTLYSGRAMGEGLVDGMDSSVVNVRRSAVAMMSAASVGRTGVDVDDASTTRANRDSAGSGGDTFYIDRPGAAAEEIVATMARKKRQANILAGIKKVSIA